MTETQLPYKNSPRKKCQYR